MKPLKAKHFIPEVADEMQLSEDAVTAIINFYWEEVRKSLSGLKHSRVHLTNLGDFVIKHWKLDDKIEALERFEENNRLKGMQQMTARFKTVETLYDLRSMKTLVAEEKQRADFIKLHKKNRNGISREHHTDMEEQGPDN